MAAQGEEFEAPVHVEQSIYGGFPTRRDQKAMEDFHRVPWSERYALLQRFDDRRFQEFGERIIHAEAPDHLPPERRTALDSWHRERHLAEDEVPWLTIKKAQEELAAIKDQMVAEEPALLAEIEEYLGELKRT